MQSERTGIENKWFALTGRVVELKVEEDGDLHIALHDVTGDKPGVVLCEIPAQPQFYPAKWPPRRCAPGVTRTPDPRIRNPLLYPAELRAHF